MPKNIAVFSDGTGQDGGIRPEQRMSNVYKLYRVCRVGPDSEIDPKQQVAFYDAGLGTDEGATATTAPVRFIQKMLGSLTGRGVTANIADCYEFIVNHYEPGDRIFLIGFSRGAYTVRAVADLLRLCGIPTAVDTMPLPRFRAAIRDIAEEAVIKVLEHGAGHPRAEFEDEREELARRFREKYGSDHESNAARRSNVAPYFIGVFDTVAALGASGLRRWLIQFGLGAALTVAAVPPSAVIAGVVASLSPFTFWPTFSIVLATLGLGACLWLKHAQRSAVRKIICDFPNKGDIREHDAEWKGEHFPRLLSRFVSFARSANAIDETRADFDRLPWGPGTNVQLDERLDGQLRFQQVWFAGNHSDVGGSYPEPESRLSDITLNWMIEEATRIPDGLKIDGQVDAGNGAGIARLHVHPAADGVQHCEIAGMKDKLDRLPGLIRKLIGKRNWAVKVRTIDHGATVDPTVSERFQLLSVLQCNGFGPYRPAALTGHKLFSGYYAAGADGTPENGRSANAPGSDQLGHPNPARPTGDSRGENN